MWRVQSAKWTEQEACSAHSLQDEEGRGSDLVRPTVVLLNPCTSPRRRRTTCPRWAAAGTATRRSSTRTTTTHGILITRGGPLGRSSIFKSSCLYTAFRRLLSYSSISTYGLRTHIRTQNLYWGHPCSRISRTALRTYACPDSGSLPILRGPKIWDLGSFK